MKPVILCIAGVSGSGKTTLANYIENKYEIPIIESWTERAPRYEGERGHNFISSEEFDKIKVEDMIAKTVFGGNRYCCLKSDVKKINTYVIDEKGIKYLKHNFSDEYMIFTIKVERDEHLILKSGISQERIDRDRGMFGNDIKYDFVIKNNSSIEYMYKYFDNIIIYLNTYIYLINQKTLGETHANKD